MLSSFGATASDVLGFVGGLFGTLYAVAYNIFARIWNTVAAFINFFGNVFKDPIGAVKILFYDLALNVIRYVTTMAQAIEDVINNIPYVEVSIILSLRP